MKPTKELNSIIYKLSNGCSNFKLTQNAKCHTTHCFVKETKKGQISKKSKTIQLYKSLVYGAYILNDDYIKDSQAAGKWVSLEKIGSRLPEKVVYPKKSFIRKSSLSDKSRLPEKSFSRKKSSTRKCRFPH